ncbi:SDR family oxidoreductase [Paenibacillus sp. DCT19]|uniref:SDR family NAD(P)-dependent oxidoreductase n=1 Tax=Paenibacillus sp. DCT19 TaxID=2211212 RepID=UPI000FE1DB08|nr:SDR family NAD(P)-dependent oxidoreductase [Paenibacillus sp. DCT19]
MTTTTLNDKKIIVTGASSGIGLEVVKLLLQQNCTIVAAAKEIGGLTPDDVQLFAYVGDLSTQEGIDQLFDYALDVMGGIDIFIANAGFAYYELLGSPDWQHISNIFNINTFGAIYSAQKMKQLLGDHPYTVMCTASGMGILPLPGYALYSATKAALRGFAEAYRYELNTGQHFQVIYPISTRTDFFKNAGNSPMPWPSQTAAAVASALVRGLGSGKRDIYPSFTFRLMNTLNRIFPFVLRLYANHENAKLQQWVQQKHREEKFK